MLYRARRGALRVRGWTRVVKGSSVRRLSTFQICPHNSNQRGFKRYFRSCIIGSVLTLGTLHVDLCTVRGPKLSIVPLHKRISNDNASFSRMN